MTVSVDDVPKPWPLVEETNDKDAPAFQRQDIVDVDRARNDSLDSKNQIMSKIGRQTMVGVGDVLDILTEKQMTFVLKNYRSLVRRPIVIPSERKARDQN